MSELLIRAHVLVLVEIVSINVSVRIGAKRKRNETKKDTLVWGISEMSLFDSAIAIEFHDTWIFRWNMYECCREFLPNFDKANRNFGSCFDKEIHCNFAYWNLMCDNLSGFIACTTLSKFISMGILSQNWVYFSTWCRNYYRMIFFDKQKRPESRPYK